MLHEASSDGAVEMVRFLATECGNIDLEAKDKVHRPCVCHVKPASVSLLGLMEQKMVGTDSKQPLQL